jgi:flagellar basal-body rod protein FlgG
VDSSYISFSGIKAAEQMIASASDNIANLNTASYKLKRQEFSSLISSTSSDVRQGVQQVGAEGIDFTVGEIVGSKNSMDVSIEGSAFIELVSENGETFLSKGGRLRVNEEGLLELKSGYMLSSMIMVSPDIVSMSIDQEGVITGVSNDGQSLKLGQIDLIKPVSTNSLVEQSGGIYKISDSSNDSLMRVTDGSSQVIQYSKELSNVDLTEELVLLMVAQNMYKANSNVININSTVSQWLTDLLKV